MIDLLCLTQQDMENLLYKAGFPRYRDASFISGVMKKK